MSIKTILLSLVGGIATFLLFIKNLLFYTVRLRSFETSLLYNKIKNQKKLIIKDEFVGDKIDVPNTLQCFFSIKKGLVVKFSIEERVMHAGFKGTDKISNLSVLRWNKNKLLTFLEDLSLSGKDISEIPVYLVFPWDGIKVGHLTKSDDKTNKDYYNKTNYELVYNSIINKGLGMDKYCLNNKLGIILYGSPGNGKTSLIRHFAIKFNLPINVISFTQDWDNHDIIRVFGSITKPGIILLEDFDRYFDNSSPLLPNCKFTFDTLLNCLDGIYATLNKTIIFLTANDINKVDPSIRLRPSRFKHIIEIGNPDIPIITKILCEKLFLDTPRLAQKLYGSSLDQILNYCEENKNK